MNTGELHPSPIEKAVFKLSSYKLIPKEAGCYILTTFNNEILYIGLTVNLYNRFKQHLDNPEKTAPTSDGKAVWFNYLIYDKTQLETLERTWLNQFLSKHGELPILNKVSSPIC